MAIIAISGISSQLSLIDVMKNVAKIIGGPFETLNFTTGKQGLKTCYLRLSMSLDPVHVVGKINYAAVVVKGHKFNAFVPKEIPDLPVGGKRKKIPLKLRAKLKIAELESPHEVITNAHYDLFLEIQYKYPGLFNLSRKTSHKLLNTIAEIIGDRLQQVMSVNPETRESTFRLTKCYRRTHPHFGDFQLILSTLHRLQDAAGAPRLQLQEPELMVATTMPQMVDNVPLDRIKKTCSKYSERVAAAVAAHVGGLDSTPRPGDTEEEAARKKVREELKKMMPYMPASLKQVFMAHFLPPEEQYRRIRIYGEPFLPSREALEPFTKRYAPGLRRPLRSRRMYNLLMFRVPAHDYPPLRAMDATVINGAKLTIRSDLPTHPIPEALSAEIAAKYGGVLKPRADDDDDDDDDDEEEEEH